MSAQSKVKFQGEFKGSAFNGIGTQGEVLGKFLRVPLFLLAYCSQTGVGRSHNHCEGIAE